MSGHLLVRRPSPALAQGELTHLDRAPVDAELALRQWHGYVDAFTSHGWTVQEVEVFLVDVRKDLKDTRIYFYYIV